MGHDVFISYSSKDKKVADAACARLEQAGHRCWIAPRDILSGVEWGKAIVDGIRAARVFVLIFSAHANRSPQVNREVERAANHGAPIIPFRIEDVTPSDSLEYFISNQHWLDALTPPLARHLDQLAETVGRLLGSGAPPTYAEERESSRVGVASWVAMGVGLAALIAGMIWLLWTPHPASPPDEPVAVASATAPKQQPPPTAPAPAPQEENLLDFPATREDASPSGELDAQPYLLNGAVRVRLVEISSADGYLRVGRLVFSSSASLRLTAGLIMPSPDRTVLVYRRGVDPGASLRASRISAIPLPPSVPNFVVLEFDEPVAQVSFAMAAVRYHSGFSGVTIRAYDASGQEIRSVTLDPVGLGDPVTTRSVALTGSASRGIRRIRFEPYSTQGGDHADGVGFLIERITIRRLAGRTR